MTPERWAQIEEIFHRAIECAADDRNALLDEACGADFELRQQVEALLRADRVAVERLHAMRNRLDTVEFPLIGQTISHYCILKGLGSGGMGLVYCAEDLKLGRRVALKVLPDEVAKDSDALRRFEREARSVAALEHPNICPVYEFGEHEGQPFLVMQLLEGQILRDFISTVSSGKAGLALDQLLDLAIQIASGLDAAHRQGIVHRDIKPANIFVTADGRAKILDFGLAKLGSTLVPGTLVGEREEKESNSPEASHQAHGSELTELSLSMPGVVRLGSPEQARGDTLMEFSLSTPGVRLGTPSYMSPEQARGDTLDARTDLFSFGLVLYEMATGQRKFKSDAGPGLREAILQDAPPPARKLDPKISPKLERIIDKALEKDREARYQSASEMRSDLDVLRRQIAPKLLSRRSVAVLVAVVLLVIGSAIFWFVNFRPLGPRELKLRQLTFNSSENPILNAVISPDGRYLALIDATGRMRVKTIATDKTLAIPLPESVNGNPVLWDIVAWFPESSKLLANVRPLHSDPHSLSLRGTSVWIVPLDGAPRKLRDEAEAFSVSADGSLIAFGANAGELGDREIWLMDPNGQQARVLYDTEGNTSICCLQWSRDGQRTGYLKQLDKSRGVLLSRDIKGGPSTTVLPVSKLDDLADAVWLSDGRLIYILHEDEKQGNNFWELQTDPRTGEPIGKPRRVTNWDGSDFWGLGATSDGKVITFIRPTQGQGGTVYLADLEADGARLSSVRRFTLNEYANVANAWTPDGKALIFPSTRNGHTMLFKQAFDSDTEEPLVTGPDLYEGATVSPDGSLLFYLECPLPCADPRKSSALMAFPMTGGTSRLILTPKNYYGRPRCAVSPATLCVLAEQNEAGNLITLTAFDAPHGRGKVLTKFETERAALYYWSLSPDGTRIAVLRSRDSRIHILYLNGQAPRDVTIKGSENLESLFWAADGNAWFASAKTSAGYVLLHIDPHGNLNRLWEQKGASFLRGLPSPDGRHLAIDAPNADKNVWMMENF